VNEKLKEVGRLLVFLKYTFYREGKKEQKLWLWPNPHHKTFYQKSSVSLVLWQAVAQSFIFM